MISGRVVLLTLGSLPTVEGLKVPLKLTAEAETREDGRMAAGDLVRSSNAQTMYRRCLSADKKKHVYIMSSLLLYGRSKTFFVRTLNPCPDHDSGHMSVGRYYT